MNPVRVFFTVAMVLGLTAVGCSDDGGGGEGTGGMAAGGAGAGGAPVGTGGMPGGTGGTPGAAGMPGGTGGMAGGAGGGAGAGRVLTPEDEAKCATITGLTADAVAGKTAYDKGCIACHKDKGQGGVLGTLSIKQSLANRSECQLITTIVKGGAPEKPVMIAFGPSLMDQGVADVWAYMKTLPGM